MAIVNIDVRDLWKPNSKIWLIKILHKIPTKVIRAISFPNKLKAIKNESKLVLRKTIEEKLIWKVDFSPISTNLIRNKKNRINENAMREVFLYKWYVKANKPRIITTKLKLRFT